MSICIPTAQHRNDTVIIVTKSSFMPWLVWLGGVSAHLTTERLPIDYQSGHIPGLRAMSPVRGMQEATD